MKVRDSGMPEQSYWESLFDITGILERLKIDQKIGDAVEVGCGYGTFTLPIAQRIGGTLHSFDIESEMVHLTQARAKLAGIQNLRLAVRDVITDGCGLPKKSMDAVFLFNILHADDPVKMLRSAGELARTGGRVFAIHWRSDVPTPRGPALAIRPRAEQIASWGGAVGLQAEPSQLLPPWHFGITLHQKS